MRETFDYSLGDMDRNRSAMQKNIFDQCKNLDDTHSAL